MFVIRKILRIVILIANLLAVVALFLCLYASYKDPLGESSWISLISFSTLFVVTAHFMFIAYWLIFSSKKMLSLLSIITLIFNWGIVKPQIGFKIFSGSTPVEQVKGLNILSWNVHLFDLGEWTKDKSANAEILKFIKDKNPDIICLQEYYMDANSSTQPYNTIIQQLGYPYFEFAQEYSSSKLRLTFAADKKERILIGHAVFSKYPLSNTRKFKINNSNYTLLSTDVAIDEQTKFNLNVTHLQSVKFGDTDMDYISSVKDKGTSAEDRVQSKNLLRKLVRASTIRAKQANEIDSILSLSDLPTVICGDFNDIPGSYVYRKLLSDKQDAFIAKGFGIGRTYRYIIPTLRIDYIMHDKAFFKTEKFIKYKVPFSDHFPIMAHLSIVK